MKQIALFGAGCPIPTLSTARAVEPTRLGNVIKRLTNKCDIVLNEIELELDERQEAKTVQTVDGMPLSDATDMHAQDLPHASDIHAQHLSHTSGMHAHELSEGDIIDGRYRVLAQIGQGGIGVVYRVRHIIMDKEMAMKVLHGGGSSAAMVRFAQESRIIAKLHHPNIVAIHDFGVSAGRPYMVMELIDGVSLSEFAKNPDVNQTELLSLFAQVCNGLAHAHERGILHRDIKPSNVIVNRDEFGTPMATLVDFGIAKLEVSDQQANLDLTKTGDVFGTPQYMSPEQCNAMPLDDRADIYAVGCLIYEAIVGSTPFAGSSMYEIIHKQIHMPPPAFPKELRKTIVGRRLEVIVLKCMAKRPEDRYAYALQIASDLKQLQIGDAGFFQELKTIYETFLGRFKADQRRTIVELYLLRLATVAALIVAVGLTVLPPRIADLDHENSMNRTVQNVLDKIVSIDSSEAIDANPVESQVMKVTPQVRKLKEAIQDDKQLNALTMSWFSEVSDAVYWSKRVHTIGFSMIARDDLNKFQRLTMGNDLAIATNSLVRTWLTVQQNANKLRTVAMERQFAADGELRVLNSLHLLCLIAAIPLQVSLGYLLFDRFRRLRVTRSGPKDAG